MFKFVGNIMFRLIGFNIKHVKHSMYDFYPAYKNTQADVLPGVVVCNHSSFLDVFALFMKKISFLSKAGVGKAPLFGGLAIDRQCTFVDRDSAKDKNKVLQILKDRAEAASQGKISPLCVFPEGTVSNGRSLMKFKKGAFVSDKPIKIYSLKWGSDTQFSTSMSNINVIACIVLTLCQPCCNLEIHEVDQDFDPSFSYRRRGIKQEGEDSWKYVADDVKEIISFITGFESSEQGFRELKTCEVL
jgi:1-acyl-sn-glycerol-3-phosphate acyltransferase